MDQRYEIMAGEALPYVKLADLQAQRDKLVANTPKPVIVDLTDWMANQKVLLTGKLNDFINGIVQQGASGYKNPTPDQLGAGVFTAFHASVLNWTALEPWLLLQYLPFLRGPMETLLSADSLAAYNAVFQPVDAQIAQWKGSIQKPFSLELINVDPRFPIDRVGFEDGKEYDKWLTVALNTSDIYFGSQGYTDNLMKFYNTVYLPLTKKR